MKKHILILLLICFSQASYALDKKFRCAMEYTKALGVFVADTLPVTSAVVDDFVDEGRRQKGDDVLQSTAELLGGGLSFAVELGAWLGTAFLSQGKAAVPPPFLIPYGMAKIPYRSTRLQWQKSKLNCESN